MLLVLLATLYIVIAGAVIIGIDLLVAYLFDVRQLHVVSRGVDASHLRLVSNGH